MDVSVIIVNYNTLGMTSECIDSVFEYTKGLSFELILVDNASSDGSREVFGARKDIVFIGLDENLGFGKACNKGFERASGRNILFLNPDTRMIGDAISRLSRFLDENPSAGACGGNLLSGSAEPNQSFERVLPSIWCEFDAFFEYLPSRIRFGRNRCWNHSGKPLRVAMVSGADLMVRRSVLDECGGAFDPRFFMYYEDTELCWRIGRRGYTLWSLPDAEIVHIGGASTADSLLKSRRRKLESFKIYCELTGQPSLYGRCVAWRRAQCRFRIFVHLFNASLRSKWRSYLTLYS